MIGIGIGIGIASGMIMEEVRGDGESVSRVAGVFVLDAHKIHPMC